MSNTTSSNSGGWLQGRFLDAILIPTPRPQRPAYPVYPPPPPTTKRPTEEWSDERGWHRPGEATE